MARPPGADDEYQELQKRFQILESERKNLFEHTQLEVKKNKEALGKLKKENKELRSNLSSLMYVHPNPIICFSYIPLCSAPSESPAFMFEIVSPHAVLQRHFPVRNGAALVTS